MTKKPCHPRRGDVNRIRKGEGAPVGDPTRPRSTGGAPDNRRRTRIQPTATGDDWSIPITIIRRNVRTACGRGKRPRPCTLRTSWSGPLPADPVRPIEPADNPLVLYVRPRCPGCKSYRVPVYDSHNLPIRYHKCGDCGLTFKSVEKTPADVNKNIDKDSKEA